MPYRKGILATGETYHIFNRSIGKERIFSQSRALSRALDMINFYRFPTEQSFSKIAQVQSNMRKLVFDRVYKLPPLIAIIAFSLMPTHYHFIVTQLVDGGIKRFISNLQNSYAKYFNIKNNRYGPCFSGRFKAVRIETEEQLIHTVRYTELNPVTSFLIKIEELELYPYTSFSTYMKKVVYPFVSTEMILNHFKTLEVYKQFVFNQSDYQRSLKSIKDLVFKDPGVQT